MLKKIKSGFSLIELSLVLIMVALVICAVVSARSLIVNSKLALLNAEMETLKTALESYINDNKITDYSNNNISLYTLMNEGYLEKDTVKTIANDDSNIDEIITSATMDVYVSKYSDGAWQYVGTNDNIILKFGKISDTTNKLIPLLNGIMLKDFQSKYQKDGLIMMNDNIGTAYTNSNEFDLLTVYFLNNIQNTQDTQN